MKKILLLILLIPLVTALNSEMIYFMNLKYDGNNLELTDVNVIDGFYNIKKDSKLPYKLELYSFDNKILFRGYFNIDDIHSEIFSTENSNIKESKILPSNLGISLPYFKEGSYIDISKNNEKLLEIDVSEFVIICGDLKCQLDERETCPYDCGIDKIIEKSMPKWIYWAGGIVLLFVFYLIYRRMKE